MARARPMAEDGRRGGPGRGVALAVLVLLLALAAPLMVQNALGNPPSRDEHQFVAAAALLASQGLLPYRDFPYFHVPYQVPVQALFIKLGQSPLAGARLCSLAFGLGSLGLLFWGAWGYLRRLGWLGLGLAAALAVWLIHCPLLLYTSGRAWNHDMALCLALAAFLVMGQALGRPGAGGRVFCSGLLLGLALGTRLSWAPLAPALLIALYWLGPAAEEPRPGRRGLPFVAGLALAGLPLLLLACTAWDDFIFGALVYPGKLTTQFWLEQGYTKAMTWPGKLDFFWRHVLLSPGYFALWGSFEQTMLIAGACLLLALPLNLLAVIRKAGPWRQAGLVLLGLPMVFLGAMLPTPNMYQYYYQALFFGLLALAPALAALPGLWPSAARWLAAPLALLAAYVLLHGGYHLAHAAWQGAGAGTESGAASAQRLGQDLARQVGRGPVLTLAPVYPLEGGLAIYPELAGGPLPFRVAHLVNPNERRARRLIAPADLEAFLANQPPAAVLTGLGLEREEHLEAYAKAHGYRPRPLGQARLWLKEGEARP